MKLIRSNFLTFSVYIAAALLRIKFIVASSDNEGPDSRKLDERNMEESDAVNQTKPMFVFAEAEKEEADNNEDAEGQRYIIKYKRRKNARRGSPKLSTTQNINLLETLKIRSMNNANADVVMLKYESDLLQLQEDENVEFVDREQKRYITTEVPSITPSSITPPPSNAPSNASSQFDDSTIPYGIHMVKAPLVTATNVSNRKVCIIDSGFDMGHSDLQKHGVDGYKGDSNLPWDQDRNGHGTHVAGTIAGLGTNNWGVTGVIPNGQLNIHIINVFGSSSYWAWESDLVDAMYECVENGADVINMSLGGYTYSSLEDDACKDITENKNVLLVAAAGNGYTSSKMYPASYESVMSVAAIDENANRASFSNYNDAVDIAAPGVDVKSTVPRPFGSYDFYSGTSMATPHVSGVAALVWSHFTSLTAKQVKLVLETTATDLGTPGLDYFYGHGLIDAKAAYDFLANNNTFSPTSAPTGIECVEGKKKFNLKIEPDDYDYTTTWELREICSGELKLEGKEESKAFCINESSNYVFTIYDSWGSGLCCRYGAGNYELYYGDTLIKSGGDFGFEESVSFGSGAESCSPSLAPEPTASPTRIECEDGKKKFDLTIVPDSYSYQTSWELKKTCTGEIVLEGQSDGDVICVDDMEYEFTIYDYNGICCYSGYGYYEIYYDHSFIKSGGSFYGEESVTITSDTAQSCAPTDSPTQMECEDGKKKFDLSLIPDDYPYQTSWTLTQFCTGETVLEGGAHGNTTCLDDFQYTFTIYDYNGICCWYGDGSYQVNYDGSLIQSGGAFYESESVTFGSSTAESCSPTMAPTGTKCFDGYIKFELEITPDWYPWRTVWSLNDLKSGWTVSSGNGYDTNVILCLDGSSMYNFEMTNDYGYGICCYYGVGEYKIFYDGILLRTGTDFGYSESTVFGYIEETVTLGFVGKSEIKNSEKAAFVFQTEKFLESKLEDEHFSTNSIDISIRNIIQSSAISDGVLNYRRILIEEEHGRSLAYGAGLIVELRISVEMHSTIGVDDDSFSYYNGNEKVISRIFETNWNTYEVIILQAMEDLDNDGYNHDDYYDNGGNGNNTIVTIFIISAVIGSLVLILLAVMLVRMNREIGTLKEVKSFNSNEDEWKDNMPITEIREGANEEEAKVEEEKVEERDTENAVKSEKKYDLGKSL